MDPNPSFWSLPCWIPMSGFDFNTSVRIVVLASYSKLDYLWCYLELYMASTVRILQLARELEEILRKQTAEPAESCSSNGSVSFLENVISPLYDIIAAVSMATAWGNITSYDWSCMVFLMLILLQEAANNKNGRAPHSAWRNYDDFNEFFW